MYFVIILMEIEFQAIFLSTDSAVCENKILYYIMLSNLSLQSLSRSAI